MQFSPWRPCLETLERSPAKTVCSTTTSESQPLSRARRQPHSTSACWWAHRFAAAFLQPYFGQDNGFVVGQSVFSLRANIDQDIENKLFAESFTIAQEGLAKRFRLYNPPKISASLLQRSSFRRTLYSGTKVTKREEHIRRRNVWVYRPSRRGIREKWRPSRSAPQRLASWERYDSVLFVVDIVRLDLRLRVYAELTFVFIDVVVFLSVIVT